MEIILDEILPKVHVTSLFTLKLVCKCFNTQISSKEFISRHVRHSVSANTSRLLFLNTTNHGFRAFDLDSLKSVPLNIHYPTTSKPYNKFNYIGSCNGLLCMESRSAESIVLLNPLTGVSFQVPHYYKFQPPQDEERFSLFDPEHGFGFDSLNNDYKIVRVTNTYDGREKVMIYRLRDNSWRQLVTERKDSLATQVISDVPGALIDTHLLHWVYSTSMSWSNWSSGTSFSVGCYRIGCFDLTTERWADDVPLPPDVVLSTEQWPKYTGKLPDDSLFNEISCSKDLTLRVLDRCLCLLVSVKDAMSKGLDIWVMKEYCVKESWTKLFKISDLGVNKSYLPVFPLCYRKNSTACGQDEILVARGCEKLHAKHKGKGVEVKWYNTKDQDNKSWLSEIHEVGDVPHFYEAFTCTGSVVPLTRSKVMQK
ncbi:F-box protein CPR1-like [Silene latifolia]|uniref:F-box protein CPR1-like n=1 Tax=Silene latifolia TaxID=37657 RepID=UPI003D76D5E3